MCCFDSRQGGNGAAVTGKLRSAYTGSVKTLSAFYFSGTGNTAYITKLICKKLSKAYETQIFDVTDQGNHDGHIRASDLILIAFPIYGGAPPIPMREFVMKYAIPLSGKEVAIAETQYCFSGDGAASMGRALEKIGAKVIAAEHFNMPNNLADCKIFPVKNGAEIDGTLLRARLRAEKFADAILLGNGKRRGFTLVPHAVGYFCQRKYWRKGEAGKRSRLKVDPSRCVGCHLCVRNCPVSNLEVTGGKAVPRGKCVMCYRCVNLCPKRAISLIGKEPPTVQYRGPCRGKHGE